MYAIYILGYIVLVFIVQTVLFRVTSRRVLHLLPLIFTGTVYLAALCLPLLDFLMIELGQNDGYSFYRFAAFLMAGVNTLGLASIGAAWLVEKV